MTTRYVATTGSDTNPGTLVSPFATAAKAFAVSASGDTVIVRGGTYNETLLLTKNLIVEAYPAESPIFQAAGSYSTGYVTGSPIYVLRMFGVTTARVEGIRFRNAPRQWGSGIQIDSCHGSGADGSKSIQIVDVEVDHNHSFGIHVTNSYGIDIIRPVAYKNDSGMQFSNSSDCYVEDPVLHDNDQLVDPGRGGNGIVYYRSHDILVHGSDPGGYGGALIYNNRSDSTLYDLSEGGRDGGAFEFFESWDLLIRGVRAWANHNVYETGQTLSGARSDGIILEDCVFYDEDPAYPDPLWDARPYGAIVRAQVNGILRHCTFYGLRQEEVLVMAPGTAYAGSITGFTVENCLFFGGGSGTRIFSVAAGAVSVVDIDHNLVYNPAGTIGFTQANPVTGDPLFVDRANRDFHLATGSPAIGAATDLDDLGARFGTAPGTPPPDPGDPPEDPGPPPDPEDPDPPSFPTGGGSTVEIIRSSTGISTRTLAAPPTDGRLLIVAYGARVGAGDFDDSYELTPEGVTSDSVTDTVAIAAKIASGDSATLEGSWTPNCLVSFLEVEGIGDATPRDSTSASGNGYTPAAPDLMVHAGDLVVMGAIIGSGGGFDAGAGYSGAYTLAAGWTELGDSKVFDGHPATVLAYRIAAADGAMPIEAPFLNDGAGPWPWAIQAAAYAGDAPAPAPGVDPDIHTPDGVYLATLDDAFGVKFRVELNGTGQFEFKIWRYSPNATEINLTRDNVVKFRLPQLGPTAIFAGFLEIGDFALVANEEKGGEVLHFAGRGLLSYLERDVAWTTSYVLVTEPTDGFWRFAPVSMPSWSTGNEPGQIIRRIAAEMQDPDRPQHCMSLMTMSFDYAEDSDGNPWTPTDATDPVWTVPVGETFLDTVGRLIATGVVEVQMSPDFELGAWNHYGRDLAGDDFGPGVVRFEVGVNIADGLKREWNGRDEAAYELVAGDEGHYVRAEHPNFDSMVQKVVFNQFSGTNNPTLEGLGLADLLARSVRADSATFRIKTKRFGSADSSDDGFYLPGPPGTTGDFWVGDTVRLHTGTNSVDYNEQDFRVAAISIEELDAGNLNVQVELGSTGSLFSAGSEPTYGGGGGISLPPGGITSVPSHGSLPGRTDPEQHPAEAVQYDNTASGLTAEDVQAAIDEIVAGATATGIFYNVMDYLAVGDGVADDTAAIIAALDAADATGGGVIYFPPGTYKITSLITRTAASKYHLLGGGTRYGPARIHQATANTGAFKFAPSTGTADRVLGVVVENLTISGAGSASSGAGLWFLNDAHIESCFIYGFFYGIRIETESYYSNIHRTTVTDCDSIGIWLNGANNCTIDKCRLTGLPTGYTPNPLGTLANGIVITGGFSHRVVNTSIEYFTQYGLSADGTNGLLGEGLYFETQQSTTGFAHIWLGGSTHTYATWISACYFQGDGISGFSAIKLGNAHDWHVHACRFGINAAIGIVNAASDTGYFWGNTNNPAGTFTLPSDTITTPGGAPFGTPSIGLGTAAAAGAAGSVIRSDATIAAFDATDPEALAFGDVSDPGVVNFAARRDHIHGMPDEPEADGGRILLADGHATPFAFTDLLQLDDGSDFAYSDP